MDRLLITGGSGFVGGRLVQALSGRWQLLVPTHWELDIGDSQSVNRYFARYQPCAVLHTAALSNTGYCQQHPEESFRANVLGAENLAKAAQQCGAKLVFFSSDQVYNGPLQKGPHLETEPVEPVNVYGRHKLEAEKRVLRALPQAVCLRASWMYDLPREGCRNNLGLPGALWKAALNEQPLCLNPKEHRGVTWVMKLVWQAEKLLELPGGVYNAGAENPANSLETGRELARLLGLAETAVTQAQLPGRNLSMDCGRLRAQGVELGDTREGFQEFLAHYGLL